jgi:hypothetical protein
MWLTGPFLQHAMPRIEYALAALESWGGTLRDAALGLGQERAGPGSIIHRLGESSKESIVAPPERKQSRTGAGLHGSGSLLAGQRRRTARVRNSLGVTIFLHRAVDGERHEVAVGAGQTFDVFLDDWHEKMQQYVTGEDFYGIIVRLDGGWKPEFRAQLLPGSDFAVQVRSQAGPNFIRGADKEVWVMVDTAVVAGADDQFLPEIDIHAAVSVINASSDALQVQLGTSYAAATQGPLGSDVIARGSRRFLPLPLASTQVFRARPAPDDVSVGGSFGWSSFIPSSVGANSARDIKGRITSYHSASCTHQPSGVEWAYSVSVSLPRRSCEGGL